MVEIVDLSGGNEDYSCVLGVYMRILCAYAPYYMYIYFLVLENAPADLMLNSVKLWTTFKVDSCTKERRLVLCFFFQSSKEG